ncbi:hypothetical protein M404DRAFT_1005215 [Pisolithus tinctorius Marx 270]|uniref:Uncharacterized protein n=1 Tax=Pisolithus tinctorius Marx 270 TaxID=870435 RepID=A0A0C3INJ8_PISTI|nr:hypothetical protein M404DRAFT_1005215 [Pisolithus tinctorius Marx 270]
MSRGCAGLRTGHFSIVLPAHVKLHFTIKPGSGDANSVEFQKIRWDYSPYGITFLSLCEYQLLCISVHGLPNHWLSQVYLSAVHLFWCDS